MERLMAQSRSRRPSPMSTPQRTTEVVLGVLLVASLVGMGIAFGVGHLPVGPALALTGAYVLASRIRFDIGAGYVDPSQLIFVPMLFVIPPPLVPIFMLAGLAISRIPDVAAGRVHPDRLVIPGAVWYAVGPALVFAAADVSPSGDWGDAPVYLLALAAQIGFDIVVNTLRERVALGISPSIQLPVLARAYLVDFLLSPIGVMAVIASQGHPYRTLVVLPLLALLAIFAQEREAHVESALQLSNAYRGTALLLGDVLEDKDSYTASHSHGVVSLSLMVADQLRLDPAARRRVEFGALLHDIGKIAVPAEIINKPGPLDDDEWAVMKLHTLEGQHMLDRVGGVLGEVGRVVRSSHEHYDGTGYPDGLRGEAIPIEARIVACCDAFSAMTTTRSYRRAMSVEAAREELVRNAGTQFDPRVVEALLDFIRNDRTPARDRSLDLASS
jgi:HD-GYP domain-containing protein (c-di-GMP phosphodiesterase class II)